MAAAKKDVEDLIGDTTKRGRNVLAGKGSGAGAAKGAAGATGQGRQGALAAGAASRTTTGAAASNAARGSPAKGSGNKAGSKGIQQQQRQTGQRPLSARSAEARTTRERAAAKRGAVNRSPRGEGKYFFPQDSKERETVRKLIRDKLKGEMSTQEFAQKHNVPTWQVRLAAVDLEQEKKLKLTKSGEGGGGMVVMTPR